MRKIKLVPVDYYVRIENYPISFFPIPYVTYQIKNRKRYIGINDLVINVTLSEPTLLFFERLKNNFKRINV